MTVTGDYAIILLGALALFLSIIAYSSKALAYRMLASGAWIVLGVALATNAFTTMSIATTWVRGLAIVSFGAALAVLFVGMNTGKEVPPKVWGYEPTDPFIRHMREQRMRRPVTPRRVPPAKV